MRSIVFLLLGFVLVYCKTVREKIAYKSIDIIEDTNEENNVNENYDEEFIPANDKSNSAKTWKEVQSLMNSMSLNKKVRAACGGGCMSTDQCVTWSGDKDCRCTWFNCLHYSQIDRQWNNPFFRRLA